MNFNSGLAVPNNVHFVTSWQQSTAADNIFMNTDGHQSHVVTTGTSHINTTGTFVNFSHSVQPTISGQHTQANGFANFSSGLQQINTHTMTVNPYNDPVSSYVAPSSMAPTPSIVGLMSSTTNAATGPAITSSFPVSPNGGVFPIQVQGMYEDMGAAGY